MAAEVERDRADRAEMRVRELERHQRDAATAHDAKLLVATRDADAIARQLVDATQLVRQQSNQIAALSRALDDLAGAMLFLLGFIVKFYFCKIAYFFSSNN